DSHPLEEAHAAGDAVAAPVPPAPARAAADRVFLEADGEAELQHLRVGGSGVGHVRLDGRAAVEVRAGTGAAADGLVVLQASIAPDVVVHRRLAAGDDAERTEESVAHQ